MIMIQKSPEKQLLLHPSENHRNICQSIKNSTQNHIGINTEQIQLNQDTGTNTSTHAEEIDTAINHGNAVGDIALMLLQAEVSETYWRLMTEQRREAIQETNIENEQLHSLVDDLSDENDKLRTIANHYDYLRNILETYTVENDSLLDGRSTDDSPMD